MSQRKIYSADLETDPFDHGHFPMPFWGGLYDGKTHSTFWGDDCCEHLVDLLSEIKGIVYFHNGGKFDFHFLLPYLPDDVDLFMIGARIVSLKFGDCELRDSYAILPMALKESGAKDEIDYMLFKRDTREANRELIERYARQDNVALFDLVTDFIAAYGNHLTLASAAFAQLKLCGINPPKGTAEKDAMLRPFFYGGRVQCFDYGTFTGEFKYIDINSAYPHAMLSKHCFDQSFFSSKKPSKNKDKFNASFYEIEAFSKGALPERTKTGISFPVGKGKFFATGWEISAGIDTDTLTDIKYIKCHIPNNLISFDPFVNKFYALKNAADKSGNKRARQFAKLILNSCYGKFALNPTKFRDYELHPLGDVYKCREHLIDRCLQCYPMGAAHKCDLDAAAYSVWAIPVDPEEAKKSYKNVGTAASITGYVRAYLWRALCAVENPLYCDTDSIICTGTADLKIGKELGAWDLEATATEVHIAGKKLYGMKLTDGSYKTASKGVRATYDEIVKVSGGDEIRIKNAAPTYSLINNPKFISRKVKITIDVKSENPFNSNK